MTEELKVYDGLAELDAEMDEEPGFNPVPVRVKINHPSALFELPGVDNIDQMEVTILSAVRVRVFYPRFGVEASTEEVLKFTSNRPFCSAQDYVTGNLVDADWEHAVPEAATMLKDKLAEGGLNCTKCPFNEWGSVTLIGREGRGKACAELRRLCLWKPGWSVPVILSIPSSSLRAWDEYCSSLNMAGYRPHYVVTRVSLEQKSGPGRSYSVAKFKYQSTITEEMKSELLSPVNYRGKEQSLAKALVDIFKGKDITLEDYPTNGGGAGARVDADDLGGDDF